VSAALPPIRRVVTGDGPDGKSRVIEDAPAKSIKTVSERPGYRAVNVWRTTEFPCLVTAEDSVGQHKGILPPKGGTILRIIDFPPEPKDPAELKRRLDATFGGIYADAAHDKTYKRHPGMHTTDTVDYCVVLSGRAQLELDSGRLVEVQAGDCVVQNGTRHRWHNPAEEPCVMAVALIGRTRG